MVEGRADINFENWRLDEGRAFGWGEHSCIPHIDGMNVDVLQREINKLFDFYKDQYASQYGNPLGGRAWDHVFMVYDHAYKCNVFVIEPYYSWNYEHEMGGFNLCLIAMRNVGIPPVRDTDLTVSAGRS